MCNGIVGSYHQNSSSSDHIDILSAHLNGHRDGTRRICLENRLNLNIKELNLLTDDVRKDMIMTGGLAFEAVEEFKSAYNGGEEHGPTIDEAMKLYRDIAQLAHLNATWILDSLYMQKAYQMTRLGSEHEKNFSNDAKYIESAKRWEQTEMSQRKKQILKPLRNVLQAIQSEHENSELDKWLDNSNGSNSNDMLSSKYNHYPLFSKLINLVRHNYVHDVKYMEAKKFKSRK